MKKILIGVGSLAVVFVLVWFAAPKIMLFCCVDDPLPPSVRTKFNQLTAAKQEIVALVKSVKKGEDLTQEQLIYSDVARGANNLLNVASSGLDVNSIDVIYIDNTFKNIADKSKSLIDMLNSKQYLQASALSAAATGEYGLLEILRTNNRDWERVFAKEEKLISVTKKQLNEMKWPSWPGRR
ncbi:hypothetical protein CU048_15025 [Beijerinckiaceae bacterium]|nr:hypothetical protein CU048_15025 [Beijerinckiaceae bacterium]